jgi:hypothetical protein
LPKTAFGTLGERKHKYKKIKENIDRRNEAARQAKEAGEATLDALSQ